MKKKVISAILCSALAAVSVVSSSAVGTDNAVTSEAANPSNYKILGETTLPNNFATFYTYGTGIDPTSAIILDLPDSSQTALKYFFNSATPNGVSKNLPNPDGYKLSTCLRTAISRQGSILNFSNGGGTYEKIRIKLSDFSDFFSPSGTHTSTLFEDTHDYNFTQESTGVYSSSLILYSGNAITAAAPDKNGMVEIYVSTKLGQNTFYTAEFSIDVDSSHSSGGARNMLCGLAVGDIDKNGYISLGDGIAAMKASTKIITLDEPSARNADTNRDGNINLKDAIAIQKYNISH